MIDTVQELSPPRAHALPVLAGLLRDAITLAEHGTGTPADIDTAMRLGAGHPAGPFQVLAALPPGDRRQVGLSPAPSMPATASATAAPHDRWTGAVGVAACSRADLARPARPQKLTGRAGHEVN